MRRIHLLLLLPLLLFCSCRKNQVALPNPIVESSYQEIQEKLGISFGIPRDATEITYSIIAGELAQADFTWQETRCTARIKASTTTELEDISGFYYKWDNELELPVGYNSATARWSVIDGQTVGICIWQDIAPGLTYSVSMQSNATLDNLFILANAVYIQLQGDS